MRRKISKIIVFVFCLFFVAISWAQEREVNGKVTDTDGVPLPGVNIEIRGTSTGTQTDFDGEFSINIEEGQVLLLSYVGFEDQEITIGDERQLDIEMQEGSILDEVVVVGYGTEKKGDISGAISSIGAESIKDRPVVRIEEALQGNLSGVSVQNTSGRPGADISVRIRGAASINGDSEPLYVVDGVPVDNISGISPNDIESIDILKDASSTAIYGARGSNGVVQITTKRGKEGRPVISLNAYTSFSNVERKMRVMNSDEWIEFNKKWYDRQWVLNTELPITTSQEDRINYAESVTGEVYQTRKELAGIRNSYGIYDPLWDTDEIEPIDWQNEIFRTAPAFNLQLSASGQKDGINYYISGAMLDQDGIIEGSSFRRYTMNASINTELANGLDLGLKVAPSLSKSIGPNVSGKDLAVSRALGLPGWVPSGAGRLAGTDPFKFYDEWGPGANNVSPYARATIPDDKDRDFRMNSNLSLDYEIIEGLKLSGLLGWNYRGDSHRIYEPTSVNGAWDQAVPGELSSSRKSTSFSNHLLLQSTLNYQMRFLDRHNFDFLIGTSKEDNRSENTDQRVSKFPNDKSYVFDKNTVENIDETLIGSSRSALVSFFGRVNYNFDRRFYLTASLRRDGSSKFGSKNRWGWFPAFSGAWKLGEEEFFRGIDWIDDAKIKISWGEAGNDRIGSAAFLSQMAQLNYPYGDSQNMNDGFVLGNLANPRLGWEKTSSLNIGLNFRMFDAVDFELNYYTKKTRDLLLNVPVSEITGFSNFTDNIGSVRNVGFEMDIHSDNIDRDKFSWKTDFNIYLNRNKITQLGSENADIRLGFGNTLIQRVGEPINSYYLLKATGVLREDDFEDDGVTPKSDVAIFTGQQPGDTRWEDANGDGKIDSKDYQVAGNYEPNFEWGLRNSFEYGNWDVSILVQGRVGGDLLSIGSRSYNRPTSDPRWNYMDQWLYDAYWSEEDPGDGKTPAFFSAVTSQYDTNWLYSASYFRVKNITLGYDLPIDWNIQRFRIYLSIDNVYRWDNFYPGFSPEGATQDNASSDWGSYPQSRTFSFGININF